MHQNGVAAQFRVYPGHPELRLGCHLHIMCGSSSGWRG